MSKKRRKRIIFLIFTCVLFILGLDQFLKYLIVKNLILSESVPILKNYLHITYVRNTGILFGLLKGFNSIFIFVSGISIFWIIFYLIKTDHNLYRRFCLILIFSGAVSNLLDRLIRGYIVDFIDFRIWPVFNIADTAITVGLVLFAFSLFRQH